MKIFGFILNFVICGTLVAGTGSTILKKQTDLDYEKCINEIYFKTDKFYEVVDTSVNTRKIVNDNKNELILSNTNSAGQSRFHASETRNVTKEKAIFKLEMTKPISGNLKSQRTIVEIKNVNGRAEITIKMEANVDHFFATERMVSKELEKNAEKVLSKFQEIK